MVFGICYVPIHELHAIKLNVFWHHLLISCMEILPLEEAFDMVEQIEIFKLLDYQYVQWTGSYWFMGVKK